ncbi:MAG: hypothetical protein IJH92_08685 [Mogibacterium sp.]|nr:hypothetical protein [Mogibacterium sp.]
MFDREALKPFEVDRDLSEVMVHLKKAAAILGVDIPEIAVVPYIYDTRGQTIFAKEYNPCVDFDYYHGGKNFLPEQNLIVIADNYPARDLYAQQGLLNEVTAQALPVKIPDSLILFTLLHELRHSWQHEKRPQEYYSKPNAISTAEHFKDPSEVDADAFAMTFIKKYTHINIADFYYMVSGYFEGDGGLRKARCKKLRKSLIK